MAMYAFSLPDETMLKVKEMLKKLYPDLNTSATTETMQQLIKHFLENEGSE